MQFLITVGSPEDPKNHIQCSVRRRRAINKARKIPGAQLWQRHSSNSGWSPVRLAPDRKGRAFINSGIGHHGGRLGGIPGIPIEETLGLKKVAGSHYLYLSSPEHREAERRNRNTRMIAEVADLLDRKKAV